LENSISNSREHFIQGVSRIANFWGFPKAMGAIYGVIYLSPDPLCLDDLVRTVGVTKGAVSTSVRNLERLNMVHKHIKVGDRKDYYTAETDFWKIIKGILKEREKSEFDHALRSVGESLHMLPGVGEAENPEDTEFLRQRMKKMQSYFIQLDNIVSTVLALDDFRIDGIRRLLGKSET